MKNSTIHQQSLIKILKISCYSLQGSTMYTHKLFLLMFMLTRVMSCPGCGEGGGDGEGGRGRGWGKGGGGGGGGGDQDLGNT